MHQQLQEHQHNKQRAKAAPNLACPKEAPNSKPFYSPLRWKPEVIKRTPHNTQPPWQQQPGCKEKQQAGSSSSSPVETSPGKGGVVAAKCHSSATKREGWFQLPDATLLGTKGAAKVPAGIRLGCGYYR
jgi:hypothetical protein